MQGVCGNWGVALGYSHLLCIYENSHALRLASELADLRAGNANPFLAQQGTVLEAAGSPTKEKDTARVSSSVGSGTRIRTQTYRVRVCCATFTQFRYVFCFSLRNTKFAARDVLLLNCSGLTKGN